jgi:hypothetical protein
LNTLDCCGEEVNENRWFFAKLAVKIYCVERPYESDDFVWLRDLLRYLDI